MSHVALVDIDWERVALFGSFNLAYSGLLLYGYQIAVFRELFAESVERFTTQPWKEKLQDGPGLRSLSMQCLLDLLVILTVYLPTFHIFREALVGSSGDDWVVAGLSSFACHFAHDAPEVVKVWLPVDLLCFSLPLHQRLPVRHAISFVWTAYYSVTRATCGGG